MPTFRFSSLRNPRQLSASGYLLGVLVLVSVAVLLRPWTLVNAQQPTPFTTVAAASYRADAIAPQSIVAGFGQNLATQTLAGRDTDPNTAGVQLPTTLAGTTVRVNNVPAPLFFVSPGQINYQIPASTPLGDVSVQVTTQSGATSAGTINVRQVAPAVFTANADGTGVPASLILRVAANGTQTYESIFSLSTQSNRFLATPINLGPEGERVFLILYLSGIRGVPDPNNDGNLNEFVRAIINGLPIIPAYAGVAPGFVGLEQINVEIPRTLLGSAALDVQVLVNGFGVSNTTGIELVAPPVTALSFRALGLPNRTVRTFATIGSYLFAGTNLGVWGSADSGTNWVNLSTGLPPNSDIRSLVVDGETLYAGLGNGGGACVSYNRGQSWTAINAGLSGSTLNISNLVFFNGILWAATQGGVCRYNGTAWEARNNSLGTLDSATLLVSGGRLCVGTRGGGIYVLGNGSVWGAINTGLPTGAQVLSLANVGSAVFAGLNGGGLCVSRNGGTSWTQVAGGFPASGIVNSIWADGTRVYAGTGTGVFVSNDSGTNWNPLNTGLAGCSGANITNIVQTVASRLLAGSTGCGVYGSALAAGPNNRAPVAYDQTVQFTEDTPIVISLSGFDADLDPLTYSIVAGPARGSLNGALPNITYTPDTNFNGRTAFTFRVTDGRQFSNTATISLEGSPVNDAPVLTVPGAQTVTVNQPLTFTVSATDPDGGQAVTLAATGLPQGATFNTTTGAFAWTPTATGGYTLTFSATDNGTPPLTATRTVSVTVNPPQANRPPVANSLAVSTPEETPRQITLTGTDPDNNPLTFTVVGTPQNGVLNGTPPNVTYTPALNFAGSDQFTYKANDGTVDSSLATVTISVSQVNDAPTLIVPGAQNVLTGQNINFKLDVEDPEKTQNQTYVYTSTNLPTGATLTKDPQSHRATFNWTPGTNGTTTINFTVTDTGNPPLSDTKTVTITVSGPSPIGNWISLRGNLPKINNFDIGVRSLEGTGNRLFAATEAGVYTSTFVNGVWDANWVAVNNGIGTNDRNTDYLTIINGRIFVTTVQGGKLFVSSDNGANWTQVALNLPTASFRIWFIKELNGKLYLGTDYGIQISTDNGATWSATLPSYSYFTAGTPMTFLPFENQFYIVSNRAPVVKRSDNGGATFTSLSNAPTIGQEALTRLGATLYGFGPGAQFQYGLYKSTNSGSSWSLVTSNAPFTSANAVKLYSYNDLLFADAGGFYFSSDAGATWTKMDAGAAPTGGARLTSFNNLLLATTPAYSVMPNPATNTAPALTVPAAQTATVGVQKVFNVSATDANNGQTVTLSASGLPLGATFIAGTGRFSWTPALAGEYIVSFTAVDNGTPALSQTKTVKITVDAPANPANGFWAPNNNGLELAGIVYGFNAAGNKLFAKTEGGVYRLDSGVWQPVNTGLPSNSANSPQARLIYDLQVDGANLYALLNSGLYRSTDAGANWTKISNTTLPQLSVNSYAMSVRGSTVLIVGQFTSNFFMRSTDGGVNFSAVGGNAQPSFPNNLISVANDFYVASYSNLYRSTNNGGTFSIVTGTVTGPAYCLAANGQTIFAGSPYGAYRSTDNGATWTQINTGLPTGQPVLSLHYSAPFLFAGTSQGVYYSLNNGGNWTAMSDGDVPQRIEAMFAFNNQIWIVAGTRSYGSTTFNNYQGVSFSPLPVISGNNAPTLTVNDNYNGTTGTALNFTVTAAGPEGGQTVTLNAAGLPQGATFTPGTGAFAWTPLAPGTYYATFTATDNGTPALSTTKTVTFTVTGVNIVGNWKNVSTGLPLGNAITSLTSLDTEVFVGTGLGVYKTSNNGASWALASEGFPQFDRSIAYMTNINDILYAATSGAIYSSNDGGASWARLPASGTSPFGVVSIAGVGNALIAVNQSSQVYVSSNFGTTWTLSTSGLPASFIGGSLVVKGSTVFLGLNMPNVNAVYKSTNSGASWTIADTGLTFGMRTNAMGVKGSTIFFAPNGLSPVGGVFKTVNDGGQWTGINTGLVADSGYSTFATNSTFVFLAATSGTGLVYYSTNDGGQWTAMNVGDPATSLRAMIVVGNTLYGASNSGVFASPLPGSN